jgi:hypothetical protein
VEPSELSTNSSAGDLFARRLGNEGRTRKTSFRSCSIDLIYEPLVERDVYPHGSTGIGQQWNGEQHSSFLDCGSDVLAAEDLVYAASTREVPPCAFKCFRMLAKGCRRVGNGLFQGVAGRKASLDIGKPDAKRTVGLFFNDCDVLCRHFHVLFSRPPAGQLVNPVRQTGRQIFSWVGYCYDRLRFRMLERVVIAANPIKYPSVPFQHRNQLTAVPFHRPLQKHRPKRMPRFPLLSISGSKLALDRDL